jgi:hypothetical protein
VAIVARHAFDITPRMLERESTCVHVVQFRPAALGQDDVALVAVFELDSFFSIRGNVVVVMAAGATRPLFVPDVMRVSAPVGVHAREKILQIVRQCLKRSSLDDVKGARRVKARDLQVIGRVP